MLEKLHIILHIYIYIYYVLYTCLGGGEGNCSGSMLNFASVFPPWSGSLDLKLSRLCPCPSSVSLATRPPVERSQKFDELNENYRPEMDENNGVVTPLKTKMTLESHHFLTSSNGCVSIVMLVFGGVNKKETYHTAPWITTWRPVLEQPILDEWMVFLWRNFESPP